MYRSNVAAQCFPHCAVLAVLWILETRIPGPTRLYLSLGQRAKNDGSLAYDVSFLISQLRCLCGAFGLHALAGEQGLGAGVHFPSQAPKDQGPWRGYLSPIVGTPNREPQEYSRNIIGIYLSGSFYSYYTPTIFLGFPVWSSH